MLGQRLVAGTARRCLASQWYQWGRVGALAWQHTHSQAQQYTTPHSNTLHDTVRQTPPPTNVEHTAAASQAHTDTTPIFVNLCLLPPFLQASITFSPFSHTCSPRGRPHIHTCGWGNCDKREVVHGPPIAKRVGSQDRRWCMPRPLGALVIHWL